MRLAWVRLSGRRIEGRLHLTLTSHLLSSLITSVELGQCQGYADDGNADPLSVCGSIN